MITILFNCPKCKLEKAKVFVRNRGPKEDIRDYIKVCVEAAHIAHDLLAPQCVPGTYDLMMPVGKGGVGYS